VNEKDVEYFG